MVSHTMTGHLTRRPSGPPDLEFSSTPPSGSVPPSVRSVGGGRKPSAPRAGAGTRSRKSLIRGFTKGPPRSGGQRASAAVPAGKWSSRPGAAHPGTASKAYLDASGHLPLGCLCRDTKSPGLPNPLRPADPCCSTEFRTGLGAGGGGKAQNTIRTRRGWARVSGHLRDSAPTVCQAPLWALGTQL